MVSQSNEWVRRQVISLDNYFHAILFGAGRAQALLPRYVVFYFPLKLIALIVILNTLHEDCAVRPCTATLQVLLPFDIEHVGSLPSILNTSAPSTKSWYWTHCTRWACYPSKYLVGNSLVILNTLQRHRTRSWYWTHCTKSCWHTPRNISSVACPWYWTHCGTIWPGRDIEHTAPSQVRNPRVDIYIYIVLLLVDI